MGSTRFFYFLLQISFLGLFSKLHAQDIPAGGKDIVNADKIKFIKIKKEEGEITEANSVFTVTTTKQPDFVYNLATKIPLLPIEIANRQPLLLTFKARTLSASLETGEAKINWLFKQSESSAPKDVILKSVSLSSSWQTYYLPFETTMNIPVELALLTMQFGFPPQKFEIKDIRLIEFPVGFDFAKLPTTRITYPGMEENAPWRIEAEKRIENIRKGNMVVRFKKDGKEVSNAPVSVDLVKHEFPFGAAINAEEINTNEAYFKAFKSLFSLAVFENDLKMKRWANENKRSIVLNAIQKLTSQNIEIKGHVLLWPGFQYLPDSFRENKGNPNKITNLIDAHVKSILGATKGKISHWDVINEVYTNKDIQTILGSDQVLFDMFKKAKKIDPNIGCFINEYGIISGGGLNKKKQDWYYDFVNSIDKNTQGMIDGLGMQSHIGNDLTPPEKVINILDRFSNLHKKIAISEFTLDVLDDEIRAKYTRDFMIAAFSESAVSEFLFWGFYEPHSPKAGLLDKNFKFTKMGQAYYDLVFKTWHTQLKSTTSSTGMISTRGFFGTYVYTIQMGGKTYTGNFTFSKNSNADLTINLN